MKVVLWKRVLKVYRAQNIVRAFSAKKFMRNWEQKKWEIVFQSLKEKFVLKMNRERMQDFRVSDKIRKAEFFNLFYQIFTILILSQFMIVCNIVDLIPI